MFQPIPILINDSFTISYHPSWSLSEFVTNSVPLVLAQLFVLFIHLINYNIIFTTCFPINNKY